MPSRIREVRTAIAAPELSPDELEEFDRRERTVIVDTRGAMAYRIGHIPGAINIRDDMIGHGMPFPRPLPVVFVCPLGERSRRYAALVVEAGHCAASLTGGITACRDAGKTLESVAQP